MGMITKKDFGTRRYLFAVAIFFGVSATTCQAADSQTENTVDISDPAKEDSVDISDSVTEDSVDISDSEIERSVDVSDSETNEFTFNAEDFSIADKKFYSVGDIYGYSIYKSGGEFTNEIDFTSEEPKSIGLYVWGTKNIVVQSGNIFLSGNGAIGIRVDGLENKISIPVGTNIQSCDKGILISYGRDQNLNVAGNISAAGNAIEFNFDTDNFGVNNEYRGSYLRYLRGVAEENVITTVNLPLLMGEGEFNYSADELNGAMINDFNLSGKIAGKRAIYIGKNSFVKNININRGAQISGDIISEWKHFGRPDNDSEPISIRYNDKVIDATKYIPDLVTNLNINTSLKYGGRINGADNIRINVNNGTFNFSGTADVVSVEVMNGARLYGGTFKVNNQGLKLAEGFSDSTTGKFINHGTIAAGSPNTDLVIDGDLISDGIIQKVSGGDAGSIIVKGNANIDGSTVTTDTLLPNETATVLIANSIKGKIRNPIGKPVPISAMLSAAGKIVNNTLIVTTYKIDNNDGMTTQESETFDAMNEMFDNLKDYNQRKAMRELYNMEPDETKKTLNQIGSNDSAQVMSVAQQNTAVDKMISSRITKIFANDFVPDFIDVNVNPMNFADGENNSPELKVKVKVPSRRENNFWINYMKNWGSLRGGTDYHGSVIVGGYDRPFGKKFRAGIFATYGTIGYGADSSRATVYDTRLGLYAGYHNRASDVYLYVNGGQLRNSLSRGISLLGLSTHVNYKSHIVEIGGEYKYDLTPKKVWHVSPFINFQTSYLKQGGYNERGAGIYNQHVEASSNTYFAAQFGLDLKRYYRNGMFGMRFGIKRGFTGVDPDLKISYEGNNAGSYNMRYKRDKTHFVCSLRGENEFADGWFVGGEAELQLGEKDKDVTASVMLRRTW